MSNARNATLLSPLQRTKLHEEIVGQLKDKIISRELMPGHKLPPERELAETLSVNRSTVREALSKLHSMELVEIKHGDGVYVKDYLESGSLELLKQMLFRDGAPDIGIMKNLSDLRKFLVPEMACHAATNRSAADLEELESIIANPDMPIAEKDWRVHNILARASGNILFVILLNSFTTLLKDYAHLYFDNQENCRKSEQFHKDVFKAIKKKKPDSAKKITLEVLTYAEDIMAREIAHLGNI